MLSLLIPGKVNAAWDKELKQGDSLPHVCLKYFWLCQK